jgi:hypothetical protein
MNEFELFFNNQDEVDFFFNSLTPDSIVLEYGAGKSTLAIAKRVKWVYSVEHNKAWYDKIVKEVPGNVTLVRVPKNKEEHPGHDGTEDDYYDYIHIVEFLGINDTPDVVLIDGRARVHCAKLVSELFPKSTIFIHDYGHPEDKYRRTEYEVVEEFLEKTGQVFALAKFKVK